MTPKVMNRKVEMSKSKSLEVISLSIENLNECLTLDQIALKGLWSKNQWKEELSGSHKICLGIFDDLNIIAFGCANVVIDELHLTTIAVHPRYRRLGLASKVLTNMFIKAIQTNCRTATLEVKSDNSAAIALYKNLGFITTGCRRNYYKDGGDALIQWKLLTF